MSLKNDEKMEVDVVVVENMSDKLLDNESSNESSESESDYESQDESELNAEKIDLYLDFNYLECEKDAIEWDITHGNYYRSIICCKEIQNNKRTLHTVMEAYNKIKHLLKTPLEDINSKQACHLCVLPIGHKGKCITNPHIKMFQNGLKNKFDTGIYGTPGNDGYVYKNRARRIFAIMISTFTLRKIKNKTKKLNCAIPLKDASKPLMLLGAYVDMLVYVSSITDINSIKLEHDYWKMYEPVLKMHKEKMNDYYKSNNREIFNSNGNTICPVNGYEFKTIDFTRDSRVDPKETDMQIGHCISRSENRYTIRGFNITAMTREGNRLIGDYDFFDNTWINILKNVLSRF